MSDNLGYFNKRMAEIGFDSENEVAKYANNPDEPFGTLSESPLFWPDKYGNICIGITGLDGKFHTYDTKESTSKSDANKQVSFDPVYRKRFANPNNPKNKYAPCKRGLGSFLYTPLPVSEKYKKGEKIKVLGITEGELTSYVAAKFGIDMVGLPGFNIWKSKDSNQAFFEIGEIVKKCNVDIILLVSDNDTLKIEWEEGKDLAKRFFTTFYASVKNFKKYCSDLDVDLHYAFLKPTLNEKGLDDLLLENKNKSTSIIRELKRVSGEFKYFEKHIISALSDNKIKEIFKLDLNEHYMPQKFYQFYESEIKDRRFIWQNGEYQANELGIVERLRSKEAAQYLLIQNTFFKMGCAPSARDYEAPENVLMSIRPAIMKIQLGNDEKLYQRVLREIDWYDGATNIPAHKDYKYFTETEDKFGNKMRWYNAYRPVSWDAVEGDCPLSIDFVKHIFGNENISYRGNNFKSYELGFDYLKLVWEQPKQTLPILALVSKERETGKTTFWDWVRAILQQNCKKITPQMLTSNFTSFYASCSLVYMEETMIEKTSTIEVLKEKNTAKKATLEGKGKDAIQIDNYLNIGLSSNNEDNFANVDGEEVRFWVRKVPKILEYIPDFFPRLIQEIPAFLFYLENRKLYTDNDNRAHFAYDLIETDALKALKENSRWKDEVILEESIAEHMELCQRPFLEFTEKDIKREFFLTESKITLSFIKDIVQKRLNKKKGYNKFYQIFSFRANSTSIQSNKLDVFSRFPDDEEFSGSISFTRKKSCVYTFYCTDYFSLDRILMFCSPDDLILLEKKHNKKFFEELTVEILRKILERQSPIGTFANEFDDLTNKMNPNQISSFWLEIEGAIKALDKFEDFYHTLKTFVKSKKKIKDPTLNN